MRFTKMEGIGNDYIYINGFEENIADPAELSRKMSQYHFGCGADGIILILPSEQADFRMRMFNNDGSESEMCGNGMRCVTRYCYDRGLTNKTQFTVESGGKIKPVVIHLKNQMVDSVTVDMGEPELRPAYIPTTAQNHLRHLLTVQGHTYEATMVNMGNPHAVIFIEDKPDNAPVTTHGPLLECHEDFPQKANIEFAQVLDSTHVNMRVWERGSGETLACGTGACAVAVAAVLLGLCEREVEVILRGGTLHIHWNEADNHVYLTGPATFVYDGVWLQ